MRIRDRISNFLYESSGFLDIIRRFTGLCLIGILPLELYDTFLFGPYHVPAWRVGQVFLSFPEPPFWISIAVWTLYFFGCIALVFGVRKKIVPIYLFLVWFYYSTIEQYIFHSSFVILMTLYLLAFAIDRQPRSLSRRIIQVAISTCYIYSALQKFHPEFVGGFTLYDMLARGNLLRPELLPAIKWLALPWWFTQALSYLVIALEAFIGIGLWFKSLRKWAVYCGVLLHAAFTVAIPGIELFAPVVWIGYLAFFERRMSPASRDLSFKKPLVDMLVALLACSMCIIMPMRFFFLNRYQYVHLTLLDRVPWGFSMFLFHEEVKSVEVSYLGKDKIIRKVSLKGRMLRASSDSDLLALCNYVAKVHPEARIIKVTSCLQINSRSLKVKELIYFPPTNEFHLHKQVFDGIQLRRPY